MTHLRIVGASACAPTWLAAAPGYLLQADGASTLIDLGPGVVHALAQDRLLDSLTSVVISHRHADHCNDVTTLAYRRAFPVQLPSLPLFAPTGFSEVLSGLDAVFGIPTLPELAHPTADAFNLTEVNPGDGFVVDGHAVSTIQAMHPVPTLSMRVDDLGFVYTADTGMTEELLQFARGADVLLAEATYRAADGIDVSAHGHLTGTLVGELAQEAGVGRLVITHLADPNEAADIVAEARAVFTGPIDLARPGLVVPLG